MWIHQELRDLPVLNPGFRAFVAKGGALPAPLF
jgi:hypothetical protein